MIVFLEMAIVYQQESGVAEAAGKSREGRESSSSPGGAAWSYGLQHRGERDTIKSQCNHDWCAGITILSTQRYHGNPWLIYGVY